MLCHVYRSRRKLATYLYLGEKGDFSLVPDELMKVFGPPEFSFSFDLTAARKLAQENAAEVLDNLASQGYHLQLQSDETIEEMLARKAIN